MTLSTKHPSRRPLHSRFSSRHRRVGAGSETRAEADKLSADVRGAVALVVILVIMSVALTIALSINLASIGELKMGFSKSRSAGSLAGADSCVDEALMRLKWSSSYTGGTLDFGDVSCIIGVVGSGGTRTIHATSTVDALIRKVEAGITISGSTVAITSWSEKTN